MQENEIIIVDRLPTASYEALIEKCIRYAVISSPFTVNRMSIPNNKKRITNISKGKIAEALFRYFCEINSIPADFKICSTPFWSVDKRDFILNNEEWDIKNNFIYHEDAILNKNYIDLPALVPNRLIGDQWSKRNLQHFSGTKGVVFLFTYLKGSDLTHNQRGRDFLEINLSEQQEEFLKELFVKYKGQPQLKEPFTEERFWKKMQELGTQPLYTLHFRPYLIVTGYANQAHWNFFRNTGQGDEYNSFQKYQVPHWYTKYRKGSCNFMSGTLWTKITNATLPIANLPSFLSLQPQLRTEINGGHLKIKNPTI